jgi:transcriptional regulator with XRE-family HTH domain
MNHGKRLRAARKHKNLTQEQLSELADVKQASISKIERGDQGLSTHDMKLCKALDIHPFWLTMGDPDYAPEWYKEDEAEEGETPKKTLTISGEANQQHKSIGESISHYLPQPDNAEAYNGFALWCENVLLQQDEVAIPFFTQLRLSPGKPLSEAKNSVVKKIRLAKATLNYQRVNPYNAACLMIEGNSMAPVLPHGSAIAIDTSKTDIINGKMYAINHDGVLQVRILYQIPGIGLRLRSHNTAEYPDEHYKNSSKIRVLGQVFWSCVLW